MVSAQIKTSTSNGNWSNPSIWSPYGIPSVSDKILIYHTVTLNQDFAPSDTIFVFNVLNVGSNHTLNLGNGNMVLVNNVNYDGRLGTIGKNSNISGNFIFQKWITRCDGFSTYGSPFNSLASDFNWYYCYQCMPNWSNLYYYDETLQGSLNNGFYDNIGGNIERGKGFFYWYSNYQGGSNFSRQISLKGSINFSSDFDFNITRTALGNGSSDDGYNLIANPFPGTIDWLSNEWNKKKIMDAIYVWNSCANTYASYVDGVGVNGGSRYIPSMQGFWVRAVQNNPQLKISSAAMVNNSQTALKNSSTSDTVPHVLRLSLLGDEIAIRLDPNSTSGLDSLTDASKFFSEGSHICSSVKSGTLDYSINSVKDSNIVISIKTRGGGTIDLKGVSNFLPGYSIYFIDLSKNTSHPVTRDFQYTFTDTSIVTFQQKFELHFQKENTTGIRNEFDNSFSVKYDNEFVYVHIDDELQLPANISMFDLSGRMLYSGTIQHSETILPKNPFPTVLKIQGQKGSGVKKIF